MTDKIYLNAQELQSRWGISAPVFATMKRNKNLPTISTLNKADLFHIDDVLAFEEAKKGGSK